MILGEESFLEEQELVLGAGRVVDDSDEQSLEVDFDAGEQLRERRFVEVPVVVEGELARMEMDLDEASPHGDCQRGRQRTQHRRAK